MKQMTDLMQAYDQRYSQATLTLWQMAAADRANLATLAGIKLLVLRSIAGDVGDFDVDYTRFRAYAYASWLDARDGGTRVTRALEALSGAAQTGIATFPPTSGVLQ